MNDPKYPDIEVELTGHDGNAMSIIGAVRMAMARAGLSSHEQEKFTEQAMGGDYNNVIATAMKWVNVT